MLVGFVMSQKGREPARESGEFNATHVFVLDVQDAHYSLNGLRDFLIELVGNIQLKLNFVLVFVDSVLDFVVGQVLHESFLNHIRIV